MFDESLVVQSAVSAFNNAALATPAFFWLGLLMIPLFFTVYKYGNRFMDLIGWNRFDMQTRVIKWTVGLSVAWIILFGGNYDVLRDSMTLLPFVTAAIVFMGMVFVGNMTRDIKLPELRKMKRWERCKYILFYMAVLAIVGLTDLHTWWGPILQILAFVGGGYMGRKMKYKIRNVPFVTAFIFLFTIAILMQPEYFRFAQLGNLTLLHLFGVVCVGIPLAGSVVLRNIVPRGKIYHSAYVKLKWLMRCMVALAGCLFVMTESVPVFVGTCAMAMGLFWLKVVHAKTVPEHLADRLLMLGVFWFGLITVMPVISCLAILGWMSIPHGDFKQEIRALL